MGRRGGFRVTAEQEAELLAVLKEKRPDFHARLTRLSKEDKRSYRRALGGAWRWYQRWKRMSPQEKAAVKEITNARLRVGRVIRAVREAKRPPTAEQRAELLDAITKALQAEQALQTIRIKKLEKEIQRLKEDLRDRAERRKEIIAERLERTLRATTRPARPKRPKHRPRPTTRPAK